MILDFRKYPNMPLGPKVGSEEKQANIPSMYRPLREECTLGTDDIMLLQYSYSPELLQAINPAWL